MHRRDLLNCFGAVAVAGAFPLVVNAATLAHARPARMIICGAGGIGCRLVSRYAGMARTVAVKTVGIDTSAFLHSRSAIDSQLLLTEQNSGTRSSEASFAALIATHRERIAAAVASCELLIVVAGLGGRAGSALALEVARIARESGALVGAVTILSFGFERRRVLHADAALRVLRRRAQLVVPVSMESIAEHCDPSTPFEDVLETGNQLVLSALDDMLERTRGSFAGVTVRA